MKIKHLFYIVFTVLIVSANCVSGQNNYADFKTAFKPSHHLFSPDNLIVYDFKKLNIGQQVEVMESFVHSDNLQSFSLIIISIDRILAGKVIDGMQSALAFKGLGFLADKWALEVLYYVSESTYGKMAELNALKNFKMVSVLK
jgi:hypothetical protein